VLKQTINKFYEFLITQTKLESSESESVIRTFDISSLRMMMKVLKIVHFILYSSFLYLAIVILPIFVVNIMKYVLSKVLFVAFLAFILDALLKIYFDINIDIIRFFDTNYYLGLPLIVQIIDFFKFLMRIIGL
jgi:hypothetical protein